MQNVKVIIFAGSYAVVSIMFNTYVLRRLIELSVYLVITESIMSTFHASSLALFRQVRFFIGSQWCLVTRLLGGSAL